MSHPAHTPEVLGAAIGICWSEGPGALRLEDLAARTGVDAARLREAYGDAHRLYLRALAFYCDNLARRVAGALERKAAVRDNVRSLLAGRLKMVVSAETPGCLAASALGAAGPPDPEVEKVVQGLIDRLDESFHAALEWGVEVGEIPSGARTRNLSRFLAGQFLGLGLLARAWAGPRSEEALAGVLEATLAAIPIRPK